MKYRSEAEKLNRGLTAKDGKWLDTDGINWRNPGFKQEDNHPACIITWNDAQEFCKWATKMTGSPVRLPTEAEWEYAARGPKAPKYPWGDLWNGAASGNVADASLIAAGYNFKSGEIKENDGFPYTAPVGSYKNGASWCGVFDMVGNLWEWCEDHFSDTYYQESPAADPPGPMTGDERVMRGGSWGIGPRGCRSERRFRHALPDYRAADNGIRVVLVGASAPKTAIAVQPAPAPQPTAFVNQKPETPKPETAVWIDLLPLANPADDRVKGRWARKDGALACEVSAFANLQLPYRPPKEYVLRAEFTRVSGTSGVALLLASSGRSFAYVMGGWGNTISGFEKIGEKGIHDNATRADFGIENRRYEVQVHVRSSGLKAFVDGKLVSEWSGDFQELGLHPPWMLTDGSLLGLGADQGETLFHRLEILEASGKGEFTRPGEAAAKAALAQQEAWWARKPKPETPNRKPETAVKGADDAWIASVQKLPPDEQVKAVVAKLKELNPGYDGAEKHMGNTELLIESERLVNIVPLRALSGLTVLKCSGITRVDKQHVPNRVADLTPLQGMALTRLDINDSAVENLAPLKGMRLKHLEISGTLVSDLTPLAGMPLEKLGCGNLRVSNLEPLRGMPISMLNCNETLVSDLSALRGMRLVTLYLGGAPVTDLSPIQGMRLDGLAISRTKVTDVSVLKDIPLRWIDITKTPIADLSVLKNHTTLKEINGMTPAEYWAKNPAGR